MLPRGCKFSRASGAAIAVHLVWRDKDVQMMKDEALGDEEQPAESHTLL